MTDPARRAAIRAPRARAAEPQPAIVPPPAGPIVPASNLSGRALFFVIAIMSFLACMTVGTIAVIADAAAAWRADIAGEITVQLRPVEGTDMDAAIAETVTLLGDMPGVVGVRAFTDAETASLLEPWLGIGVDLSELPVPRIVVAQIDRQAPPNLAELRAQLVEQVPSADLDDHEMWQRRLRTMANTLVVSGLVVLGLVLAATVLSVIFATRGAMASNRDTAELLHLVGAKESFIARQFERHFLRLGFKGGLTGGIAAILAFAAARWITNQFAATPTGDQFQALFGAFSFGWNAVLGIAATVAVIAVLTAMTSRMTVFRFLRVFD